MSHAIENVPHNDSEAKQHRCAKCLEPMPAPDYVVNKSMAYCEDCSRILHLGESKESRMFSDLHDIVLPILPEDGESKTPGP